MRKFTIGNHIIGKKEPVYVIAEIGSNFDGSIERAKKLAQLAKEAGANAYKIQNFLARKIVSKTGFSNLKVEFQAKWDKPVVDVYKAAEFPREWLSEVAEYCREIGIDFFSSPYDTEAVDQLEEVGVPAHKIGSGEIDNLDFLRYVGKTMKPVILGVGAATMEEIGKAVATIRETGNETIALLQCVTNYPSSVSDANIQSMLELEKKFGVIVGYSDHTIGFAEGGDDPLGGITVPIASVALGACIVEKHFTDDKTRKGPDHPFAMEVGPFKKMVEGIRVVEKALGDGVKRIMPGEKNTVVIQRRGVYAARDIAKGEILSKEAVTLLRPAIGIRPLELDTFCGKTVARDIYEGEPIDPNDLE